MVNCGGTVRVNPLGIAVICAIVVLIILFKSGGSGSPDDNFSSGRVAGSGDQVSLKQLLAVAIGAAKNGGAEVARVRKLADIGETSKGKTKEGANDPKTDGDMSSHRAMYWGIKKAFPNINLNVISEEHENQEGDLSKISIPDSYNEEVDSIVTDDVLVPVQHIAVWIDPLDATQEYTENLLQYVTTMVCVAVKGSATIGVIHKPFNDGGTAWAWAGPNYLSRSVLEDASGNKDSGNDISKSRIIVSRSHAGEVNSTAQSALGSGIKVTPAGGAGFKTWEVVKGNQDAYVHTTLIKKWDICAGNAILKALGGKLTTLKDDTIDYAGEEGSERNEGGVLATMHHHKDYVEKLSTLVS